MLKWSPWPAQAPETRRFQVKLKLLRVEGLGHGGEEGRGKVAVVEVRWKGPAKTGGLVSLGRRGERKARRNVSESKAVDGEAVEFGDEFENVCGFQVLQKDQSFIAWDLAISLLYGDAAIGEANKLSVIGSVSLNLAKAAWELQREKESLSQLEKKLPVPLKLSGVASDALLYISMRLVEMRTSQEASQTSIQDDGFLRRMTSYVSPSRRMKKKNKIPTEEMENPADKKFCGRLSGETDDSWTCDTDSPDEESGGVRPDELGYSSITSAANLALDTPGDESSVYYGNSTNSDKGTSPVSESKTKGGLLSWRKRKLSFRTGKRKEEPLLKKENDEEGGDDIDIARRELQSSSNKPTSSCKTKDDTVNSGPLKYSNIKDEEYYKSDAWEEKELISRDGQAKIRSLISFASIDQRSESASGESACAVLVAVISDWVHKNRGSLPTKSQFDVLIKEGSHEWLKLCEKEAFLERFPDKHFDLETVLEEGVRPVGVAAERSFVGFFNPDSFEFLEGAMSFDTIWDEISTANTNSGEAEQVYIVSWNDHFFLLKVDPDAFYIIDTLGERLFEGCQLAYILRFDDSTSMYYNSSGEMAKEDEGVLLCRGKDCCKEYIKRFLAAIPLRELEEEKQKGNPPFHHHKLQIEFHLTRPSSSGLSSSDDGGIHQILVTDPTSNIPAL